MSISNNYLLLSQGAISEKESSSIINAICGDSSLKIGDTVRLLPVGTGEGFTQLDDLLPRVGILDEIGALSYGVVVGGDFEGAYGIDPNANILSLGLIAAFFGDDVRICTQGNCLAFASGVITGTINIGDALTTTATDFGLVPAIGNYQVIARALQSTSLTNSIIAINVQREGKFGTLPAGDLMLYQDFDIMQYEDSEDMDYET